MNKEAVKVFFVQEMADGTLETESVWCAKSGENFEVDNIPFVAKRISLGDIIKAEYDKDDKAYYFEDFISVSGNTTIRVYFDDDKMIQDVRQQLNAFGCESEAFLARNMIAVNIPKALKYKPVKSYLDDGENNGFWTYEESCLMHDY